MIFVSEISINPGKGDEVESDEDPLENVQEDEEGASEEASLPSPPAPSSSFPPSPTASQTPGEPTAACLLSRLMFPIEKPMLSTCLVSICHDSFAWVEY